VILGLINAPTEEGEYMSDTRIEDGCEEDDSEAEEPPTVFPPPGSTHVVLPLTPEEQQLADRAKDILFNAELADVVIEHLPDALVIVDETGIIQRLNTQAEILLGYPRADLIGQCVDILVPEAERQTHEVARHIYMETPHLRPLDLSLPLHIRRKTGGVVPVNIAIRGDDSRIYQAGAHHPLSAALAALPLGLVAHPHLDLAQLTEPGGARRGVFSRRV